MLMAEIKVKTGDAAPQFTAPTTDGSKLSLDDITSRKHVVLYFYPKDDTPGCTKEACSFRDNLQTIRELGAEIIGVSVDDVQSHKKFSEKYRLPFTLVSDTDKQISTAYGVLKDPGTYTNRVTFLIEKGGKIVKIFPKVDVSKHTEEILVALKELPRT
jgi:peroxiredoxin Q/BCP